MSDKIAHDLSDPATAKVLWAAMCSMVMDVHAPQDNLTESEWKLAESLLAELDAILAEDAGREE